MRILYVTNDLPWPLTSGYLRHYHFIRELSSRNEVTLLSLLKRGHAPGDEAALRPFTEQIVTIPATIGGASAHRRMNRLRALLTGGDPAAIDLGREGAALARSTPYDAILLSGKRTAPALRALPDLPLVVDLCDATSTRLRRQARHGPLARRPRLALEYVEMRRIERSLVGRARSVLFASVRDRDAIVGPSHPRHRDAVVVPNGVDLSFWRRSTRTLGTDSIVLTGAMDYPPNVDAATELVDHILPLVRHEVPGARVSIVGRDPVAALTALGGREGVEVTGYVDDVRPYLESAAVFAAPIRFGAGIQNKVLEAMAMEVPVVASPLAADGLRTEGGGFPPIDVATDRAMAARAIIARLHGAAAGAPADAALRAYVADDFDWARSAARVERLLCDAMELAAGGPSEGRAPDRSRV